VKVVMLKTISLTQRWRFPRARHDEIWKNWGI